MPAQFTQGITFLANATVTNTDLHQLVNNGSLLPGAVTEQNLQTANLATADVVLFNDVSAGSPGIGALTKLQLAKLWAEPFEIGQTNKVTANFAFVSAPVAQFTSASIANLTGASAITGSAPSIAKAWVNFNGGITALTAVTFTFVGTTITATKATHGLAVGDSITISGQTGNNTVLNGTWTVATVPTSATFTFVVLSTPAGALASATVQPTVIRSAYNVDSITYNAASDYTVNFTAGALPNANYVVLASCNQRDQLTGNDSVGVKSPNTNGANPTLQTATQVQVLVRSAAGAANAQGVVSVAAFGR